MAWNKVDIMEQRKEFVLKAEQKIVSFSELCRMYGISRPTGYIWLSRWREGGIDGLLNRSRAPLNHGRRVSEEIYEMIIMIKLKYYTWGPRKIKAWLDWHYPEENWPAASTIGNILDCHGLVRKKRKRSRVPLTHPLEECQDANDTWCADYKGALYTHDGHRVDPLTISDAHTRYLFQCTRLKRNNFDYTWPVIAVTFREFGLPKRMRFDNGPPFATIGVGRLAHLSINLIKAGVIPEWIEPGHPEQNGRHERTHGTLEYNLSFQEQPKHLRAMDRYLTEFREEFNFERPHEALGQIVPGDVYEPSPRQWNGRLQSPEYPKDFEVRQVRDGGSISWQMVNIYIGKNLIGEPVGLEEIADDIWAVSYGPVELGFIDYKKGFHRPSSKWNRKKLTENS